MQLNKVTMDTKGSRWGPGRRPSPSECRRSKLGLEATWCEGSRNPACLLVPNHIPTPNTADRARNQALMRIFRVSLGPAPAHPGCFLWEHVQEGGSCM